MYKYIVTSHIFFHFQDIDITIKAITILHSRLEYKYMIRARQCKKFSVIPQISKYQSNICVLVY